LIDPRRSGRIGAPRFLAFTTPAPIGFDGSPEQLDAVESVEYTLHPTFPKPVRLVQERSTKFRLESSGWGSFLLRANLARKDGSVVPATLKLDLRYPSRDEAAVPQRR